LGNAENRPFRKIQQVVDRSRSFIAPGQHLRGGINQLSRDCFITDNLAVIPNIGGTGNALNQLGKKAGAADRLQFPLPFQPFRQRDLVDHFTGV